MPRQSDFVRRRILPLAKLGVIGATGAMAPIARRASRLFGESALPKRSAWSTADYVRALPDSGVEVREVFPVDSSPRAIPADFPSTAWSRAVTKTPVFVAQLPGGRVVGDYGAIVTDDGTLLFDLSAHFGRMTPGQHPINLRLKLPPVTHVEGTVASLASRGVDNYCHFLLEVLPKLNLFERAGMLPQIDQFVVAGALPFQRDLLAMIGVNGPILDSGTHPHVQADVLLAATVPDVNFRVPTWVVDFLRTRLLPGNLAPPHRRIYVCRGQAPRRRRVVNEHDVVSVLARHGIASVDPGQLSVEEQIRVFGEAELIVAPHGAGLANLVFCPKGAAVVELFSPDYANPCYAELAARTGLRYRFSIGNGTNPYGQLMGGIASDITANVADVERLVASISS